MKASLKLHPLARLYAEAERMYRWAQARLVELRRRLREVEAELGELELELAREYGPGYLTVKTVRKRSGRKYRYPVWRVPGRSDVYLTRDPRARRILDLRAEARQLRAEIVGVKRVARQARVHMEATREYRNVCIAPTGEYVTCPPEARS